MSVRDGVADVDCMVCLACALPSADCLAYHLLHLLSRIPVAISVTFSVVCVAFDIRRLFGMSTPMTGSALLELFRDMAKPYKILEKHEGTTAHNMCEIAWAYQDMKAKDFIVKAEGKPLLYSYGSDGTPLLTRSSMVARLPSARLIVRNAGRGVEFLLERAFLCRASPVGDIEAVALFKPPTPLDKGKAAWNQFNAACKFFPLLRRFGHVGISVSHYCADRALF